MGWSYLAGDDAIDAFLYSGDIMTDLGNLGGGFSYAFGINDSGQVVGDSNTPGGGPTHAFLYSGGVMIDLNSLLPLSSGWVLQSATAINDSGQIVGMGTVNGQTHAFLLDLGETSVPELGSMALVGLGLAAGGLLLLRSRRSVSPDESAGFQ